MAEPTILYVIGAAKSGTTWLHHMLSQHPECHFRRLKELHYFSSFDGPNGTWRLAALDRRMVQMQKRALKLPEDQRAEILAELQDVRDWRDGFDGKTRDDAAYLAYLTANRGSAKVVGDFTPAYAMLPEARLADMAGLADSTKFLYLLRDPLDRLWSNIRMAAKRAARKGGQIEDHAASLMQRYIDGNHPGVEARADYAGALQRLKNVIMPGDRLFAFFETLFSADAMLRITRFLGIGASTAPLDQVVHGGKPIALDADLRRQALLRLKPQYEQIIRFFDGQVPEKWQAHLAEVS